MRKVTIVRLGIAAAVATVGVAGAIAAGCTSGDNGVGNDGGITGDGQVNNPDGAVISPDGAVTTDGGPKADTGAPDTGPPPIPANLVLTHAAPGVGPFRLCFGQVSGGVTKTVALPALPDSPSPAALGAGGVPGVFPGTIGAFPAPADLSNVAIAPFVIFNIAKISGDVNFDGGSGVGPDGGSEETCDILVGKDGTGGTLTLNTDYVALPTVPSGSLLDNTTYLLALVGCLPGVDAGVGEGTCGTDYTGAAPNVKFGVAKLDTTTVAPDGGIAVQFVNLSTAIEGSPIVVPAGPGAGSTLHPAASDGIIPGIVLPSGNTDGGAPTTWNPLIAASATAPYGSPVKYNATAVVPTAAAAYPFDPAAIATATGGQLPVFGFLTAPLSNPADPGQTFGSYPGAVVTPDDGGSPAFVPSDFVGIPFSVVNELSSWSSTIATGSSPATFTAGVTYTFAVLGDPLAPPLAIANPDGGPGPIQNPGYLGTGLHIVAFPNNFTP